jgi:hypothetical protein
MKVSRQDARGISDSTFLGQPIVAQRDVMPVSSGRQRRRAGEGKREEKSVLGRQSNTHTGEGK